MWHRFHGAWSHTLPYKQSLNSSSFNFLEWNLIFAVYSPLISFPWWDSWCSRKPSPLGWTSELPSHIYGIFLSYETQANVKVPDTFPATFIAETAHDLGSSSQMHLFRLPNRSYCMVRGGPQYLCYWQWQSWKQPPDCLRQGWQRFWGKSSIQSVGCKLWCLCQK